MYLELYYNKQNITLGNSLVKKNIHSFLPKKQNYLKKLMKSIFEEHTIFNKQTEKWSDKKSWNTFVWLFIQKYRVAYEHKNNVQTANIVLFDMIALYKGWRHCKSYPVNGQRTWSNGKSPSKNNTELKKYRFNQFQKMYGPQKNINYATLIQAEAINKLWLKTWPFEWMQGRYHAIKSKSKKGTSIPIDIQSLAKAITTGYKRYGKGERWNSSKKALKTVTIGLPLFFSRYFFGNIKKKHFRYQLTLLQPEKKHTKNKKKQQKKKKTVKKKTQNKKK